MRSIAKFSTRLSIAGLAVLMGMSAAFANTLSEVQINAQDSGYGIVLKTDETPQMKKTVSSDNKLTIQLKDVEVSPDLNTVYNNVANLDNVTVAPAGKSDIKIIFKGEGISNSKVYFENIKTDLSSNVPAKETISLSAPVSSYTPVYNTQAVEADEELDQTANPQVNEVLTQMHISRGMLVGVKSTAKKIIKKATSGDINLITVIGVLFIIGSMLFRPKKKAPVSKQPSLSEMLAKPKTPQMEREIALNRRMSENMSLTRPDGLGSVNPVNAGYGMRAYQNSQKNPYVSNIESAGVSGIPRRKTLHAPARPVQKQSVAAVKKQPVLNRPVTQNPILSKSPAMVAPKTAVSKAEPSDLDSVKFLESITKIYEKNGRADLAKGLKDNLRKAQATHSTGRTF